MEPVSNNEDVETKSSVYSLGSSLGCVLMVLAVFGALELAAYLYEAKTSRLDRDGVVTSAEIVGVSEDGLGSLLESAVDSNRSNSFHSDLTLFKTVAVPFFL